MIESLCDSFAACVNDEKTVIVLDNSPGYVGLGKAIHDWLTDIGPDCGKFLTISSLDVQDLNSCLNAIQAIENIVEQKFEGAKYYHQLKKNIEKIIEEHCIRQQQIMRENGLDERLIRATASHGYGITVDIEPLHEMEKVLYAVDELTGLIGAVAIMRPSKSVMDLEVPSVRKKYTYTFHRYLGYFMG
jgi:hypothetical protein